MNGTQRSAGTKASFAALLVAILTLGACSAPGLRTHVGFAQYELDGTIGLSPTSGIPVNSIDLGNDLGLDEADPSLQARVELDAGPIRLTATGFRYADSGNGTITGNFGGIPIGTSVTSSIDLMNAKIALTADLLDTGLFGVVELRLSPGIAVDLFDIQSSVASTSGGLTEDIDELLPVPMPFLQAEVQVDDFSAVVDVGAVSLSFDDFDGTFVDLEGFLSYRPVGPVELYAGYRYVILDTNGTFDGEDFLADLEVQGFFVGAGVIF